jgi:flavin-dependent dehydrogenase
VRRTSALIVGGGPAGASAAIALARGGAMPVLVERCARPIRRLRLASGRRVVEAALPREAAGLSRRRLDAALLQVAEEAGAAVLRGRTARALDGHCLRLDGGEEMEADAIFLATGKHELRGAARAIGDRPVSVGLRAALPPSRDLDEAIELHLFDGGYAGLLSQEDGAVNLCLTVTRARMTDRDALLAQLLDESPLLAERIGGALPARWEAVSGVPYGWRALATAPGCYRVGDQAAVIASIAGDGIAIALASGQAAAHACLAGESAEDFQARFAHRAARPVAIAEGLRSLAARPRRRGLMMMLAGIPGVAKAAARLTRIG